MYYQSNALYNYLDANPSPNHFYVAANMWMLVYGNSQSDPLLLVLVSGVSEVEKNAVLSQKEQNAFQILGEVAKRSGVPLEFIRFAVDGEMDSFMQLRHAGFSKITSDELKSLFFKYGLPVSNTPTQKDLNDIPSSAYHAWQREQLGRFLKVSDIDLINLKAGVPTAFYELKRSHIDLPSWNPFPVDFSNFILLSKLAQKGGLKFQIAYNRRTKNPLYDDISRIKVFDFMHSPAPVAQEVGTYSLADFLNL